MWYIYLANFIGNRHYLLTILLTNYNEYFKKLRIKNKSSYKPA